MKIKKLSNALLLSVLVTCAFGQITKENVDELAQKAFSEIRCPGATVLIAQGDEIIHHKGYGLAHLGFKVPASTDTRYFASGLNLYVLVGITMQFVEQKKINLDDKVLKYLPKLPPAYEAITIKHLLTSTSGIPDYHYLGDRYEGTIGQPHHYDEVLARFMDLPLSITPGSKFEWSLSNYAIITLLLEEVSGKSYRELLQAFISPLKLTNTAVIDHLDNIERYAQGYRYIFERDGFYPMYQSILNFDPATRIYSTTNDLFEIWQGLRKGKLISKESFSLMTSREEAKKNNSGNFGYGLGLAAFEGKEMIHFGGGSLGYSSAIKYIPTDDMTILVMANTGVAQEANQIATSIARAVIKIPASRMSLPKNRITHESIPVNKDTVNMITGTYLIKLQMKATGQTPPAYTFYKRTLRVFVENGQLQVQHLGELPSPLLKQKNGTYRIVNAVPQASLHFTIENGKVKRITKSFDDQSLEGVGERIGDADVKTFHEGLLK